MSDFNLLLKHYKVYKARLQYNEENAFKFSFDCENLDKAKKCISDMTLNPFYTVIFENDKIVYNEHLEFWNKLDS